MIYSTTVINPLSLNSCELKLQSVLNILDDFLRSWTDSVVHFRENPVLTCVHMALLKEVLHLLFKENKQIYLQRHVRYGCLSPTKVAAALYCHGGCEVSSLPAL